MRLYRGQTLRWHMDLMARIYPGWDEPYAGDLVKRFELRPEQALGGFSHGQRVKALLLLCLARRPRLLLLDEPTTGLDRSEEHTSELQSLMRISYAVLCLKKKQKKHKHTKQH